MSVAIVGRVVALLVLLSLAGACGGDDDNSDAQPSANADGDELDNAENDDTGDVVQGTTDPVDVCALLSPEDGAAVAKESGLGGDVNATSTFGMNATPEAVNPSAPVLDLGACRFEAYYVEAGGTEEVYTGAVVIHARSAENFSFVYGGGTPLDGLGDEAYTQAGATGVRKGNVMLSAGENSYGDDFTQLLFARMAPNLP